MKIRIATRKSQLALWQAEFVKAQLLKLDLGLEVELLPMSTKGDKILDVPLAKIGGKGLFLKELELAILENRADIAVHSMKDVPVEFPEGLGLSAICEREDPRDAFVSNKYRTFSELPEGAVVGTSSLRRQAQLINQRPDLLFRDLRGNVNSRLQKLDDDEYEAIILAVAGMKRLGMEDRIKEALDIEVCLPAVGQGAVGIESRKDDAELNAVLLELNHQASWDCVMAERAMNAQLDGGCQVPIAGHATILGDEISMQGLVASVDGANVLRAASQSIMADKEVLGQKIADDLLRQGAKQILSSLESS